MTSLQTVNKVLRHCVICDVFLEVEESPLFSHNIVIVCNENILFHKLDSESWEVRDSTLELLQSEVDLGELSKLLIINLIGIYLLIII